MNDSLTDIYKTLNILCVEDDLDILETYKSLFSLIFKEVYFATNGKEGFESFQKHKIDIVLTDHMMPIWTGLEMTKAIREVDPSIPIVMVTALESIEMLREAIDLNITSFLKKPFTSHSLFNVFNVAVKLVIVERYIMKEQTEKIEYNHYQENLSFDKEKIISTNECSRDNKLLHFSCNLFYKPKDILSGDSYIIKKISPTQNLVFIVDGMGKGISASLTAMLCSAFVNYYAQKMKEEKNFSLTQLLDELLRYIQPTLSEYEVVSASFFYFDAQTDTIEYALFSMPPALYLLQNDTEVQKICSNNPPISPYSTEYNVKKLPLSNIRKMLIYSDGLNECTTDKTDQLYTLHIKEDFLKADSIETFQKLFEEKCSLQEDDITYIFLYDKTKDEQ